MPPRRASMPPTSAGSEHAEQARFFAYLSRINHPATEMTFAIPNGFLRTKAMRLRAWQEGVKSGVSDVFTAYPVSPYAGLWIEMKVKGNTLTKEQKKWFELVCARGYRAEIAYSAEEALKLWADYLGCDIRVE